MRLERPLVFRFDNPCRTGEDRVELAGRDRHLALNDGCLTDVVVECPVISGKGGGVSDHVTLSR
jgi:hypothetical protein